jgi:hypothetical protein
MTETEQWVPVPLSQYSDAYSVSSRGRIRSEHRQIVHIGPWGREFTRTIRARMLRPGHDNGVTLSANGVPRWVRIADLVQQAFGEAG